MRAPDRGYYPPTDTQRIKNFMKYTDYKDPAGLGELAKILLFRHFKSEGRVILAQMQALIPWHNASDSLNQKATT